MKKILFLILLLVLPMSNLSADEEDKFYTPVIELYEKAESSVNLFFNKLTHDVSKRYIKFITEQIEVHDAIKPLGFQTMEQPLKGFDFVCYNSCKERNDDSFCRKQCSLQ
jgi:hypothetical protein|tara:strand:- start:759 stop:1088 length:330 start_codon:yes stop_codon:yes gene_type:complete